MISLDELLLFIGAALRPMRTILRGIDLQAGLVVRPR